MSNIDNLSPSDRLQLESFPSPVRAPSGVTQYGGLRQLATSAGRGLDEALISGQLPNVLARNKAKSLDEASGLKPLTKDEFDKKGFNMYGGAFEQDADETPSQTQLRFNLFLKRSQQQEITSSGGGTLQKIGISELSF